MAGGRQHRLDQAENKIEACEVLALALRLADGLRDSGASAEAQARAVIEHLGRNGFVVRPRVGREGTRPRRASDGATELTGSEVRIARSALKLSRAKLAEMAGIGRDTLMDFEHGRKVPQRRTLDAIGAAIGLATRGGNG